MQRHGGGSARAGSFRRRTGADDADHCCLILVVEGAVPQPPAAALAGAKPTLAKTHAYLQRWAYVAPKHEKYHRADPEPY